MVMPGSFTTTAPRVLHTTIAHVSKPSAGTHTYTQYLVRVSDERSPSLNWAVYRRYSEFRDFKLALGEAIKCGDMCAHCTIMSKRTCFVLFPHRRLFGNLREKTLEARRIGLNTFLDAVAKHARTCRESMTCQTRPLMDKFLMVNDMRYTYLSVDMSEADAERSSKVSRKNRSMSGLAHRSSSMVSRVDRLSNYSDYREEAVRSCNEEWMLTSNEVATDSKGDQLQVEKTSTASDTIPNEGDRQQDTHQQDAERNATSHLLSYSKDRRWNDNTQPLAARQSLNSERERPAYKQSSSSSRSRHSDPGLARYELLNFTRGSFSGGGRTLCTENRPRSRKVHLSSVAKRVKKLEEAEARFSVQAQSRKPRCLPRLEPIPEET